LDSADGLSRRWRLSNAIAHQSRKGYPSHGIPSSATVMIEPTLIRDE